MNRQLRRTHPDTALPTITLGPNMPGAACKGLNPRLWDRDVDGETPTQRTARYEQAIPLCHACPAAARCLAYRLAHPELAGGIWGGRLFTERDWNVRSGRHATGSPPGCRSCGGALGELQRQWERYCSDTCRKAADRDRKRALRSGRAA